jgi:dihydroxyacid dehydratase/phosphogluconate dehydratase
VRDGDRIELSVERRELNLLVPAADRADLRAAWHQALRQLPAPVRRLIAGA